MSDDGSSPIDDHILALTGVSTPKVCFVPTASGDSAAYGGRFTEAFRGRAQTSVLSLFGNAAYDYGDPSMLLEQDVVYVGGGSTANLLALWRLHGLPEILSAAAASGTVLAGISAGMNCWFVASSTDSFGPLAPLNDGLGFIAGSACPHYHGEPGRRDKYLGWVGDGVLPTGHAVDDFTAIVFRDGCVEEAIAERRNHGAYRVGRYDGAAVEEPLDVRQLRGAR